MHINQMRQMQCNYYYLTFVNRVLYYVAPLLKCCIVFTRLRINLRPTCNSATKRILFKICFRRHGRDAHHYEDNNNMGRPRGNDINIMRYS